MQKTDRLNVLSSCLSLCSDIQLQNEQAYVTSGERCKPNIRVQSCSQFNFIAGSSEESSATAACKTTHWFVCWSDYWHPHVEAPVWRNSHWPLICVWLWISKCVWWCHIWISNGNWGNRAEPEPDSVTASEWGVDLSSLEKVWSLHSHWTKTHTHTLTAALLKAESLSRLISTHQQIWCVYFSWMKLNAARICDKRIKLTQCVCATLT